VHESLSEIERRVFGVLLEKSLAQPGTYPLTLNAVVLACNQKSNRAPVMHLDEDRVWETLDALRQRGLVSRILAGDGGRVDRFRHEVHERFGWSKPQRAVMAELLLRGPQTVGELRSRCSRMFPFEDAASVLAVLESLSESAPPAVAVLPRAAGQSVDRYTHLFYPEGEQPVVAEAEAGSAGPAAEQDTRPDASDLHQLRAEVSRLRETVGEMQQRLNAIEHRWSQGAAPPGQEAE
jgi:uncharacterized protein YceH (UPF0502 family)